MYHFVPWMWSSCEYCITCGNADSPSLIIQEHSGFSGPEKRRSSASTLPNYCRNKDAYLGVAKDLQKLIIAESIESAGQRRELATVTPAEEQSKCEPGAALLSCCGYAELYARMGMAQQGTLGTSQHNSGRSHESAGRQWACGDGVTKFRCCGELVAPWNSTYPTSRESRNGIALGERMELR